MKKGRFDKKVEQGLLKQLDKLAKKLGLRDVRHAVNKWSTAQRIRISVEKERRQLSARLAELESER